MSQVVCSCTTPALMSAQKHTLPMYIWFWYNIMQNNMSIQEDSITYQHCCIVGLLVPLTLICLCGVRADPGKLCQARVRLLSESQNEQST